MTRRFLGVTLLALASAAPAVVTQAATADGLPVTGTDVGPAGIATPGGETRYVALAAASNTVVARVDPDGGRVLRSAFLRGRFTVPAVALDGTPAGLSRDGKTLVLIRPRAKFPRARTTFAILDAERLHRREVVTFRGDFSFDAIAPQGTLLYLVQYVSRRDPTRYVVRAYDVGRGRLLSKPVVDKREPSENMRGYPITRATSRDGRWAYTLYDRAGQHPFIHALDTLARRSVCIDLHGLTGREDLFGHRLALTASGRSLVVLDEKAPVAVVDTRSFRVSKPAVAGDGTQQTSGGMSGPLLWVAGAGLAVLATALLLALRRHRSAPDQRPAVSVRQC